jgi:para-aminobenzoate synthetase component 1
MIVDLERNDLGKLCRPGSVVATSLKEVESFDYVHHLVATIRGELNENVSRMEALRSLFPGGSITGAPKKRAMEIIQELEPDPRGIYTGAIGFWDYSSTAFFNIAIRTLEIRRGMASFGVGGGVVAESNPRAEYEETLAKARVLLE